MGGALVVASWASSAAADRGGLFLDSDFGKPEPASSAHIATIPKNPREGGTVELGIGIAYTTLHFVYPAGGGDPRETHTVGVFGPALPSLGFGGFLSKSWALLFRLTGTAYVTDRTGLANIFVGPVFQHWTSERFMIGGGLGLGIGIVPSGAAPAIGTSARIGYSLTDNPQGSTRIAFEVTPTLFSGGASFTGTALNFEWQAF